MGVVRRGSVAVVPKLLALVSISPVEEKNIRLHSGLWSPFCCSWGRTFSKSLPLLRLLHAAGSPQDSGHSAIQWQRGGACNPSQTCRIPRALGFVGHPPHWAIQVLTGSPSMIEKTKSGIRLPFHLQCLPSNCIASASTIFPY